MNDSIPLNMDFSKALCSHPDEQQWLKSPADGVSRIHLEREAAESGHTTSFVKFEPDSFFPPHQHPLGEEIYVLDGTFSDERGDYPAGTYIRNPPGSHHKPFTRNGCILFVKLDQFQTGAHTLEINGWAFIEGHDSVNSEIYIVLKSADRTYVFTTETVVRENVTEHFKELGLNLDYSGFTALIPTRKIANGEYSVGIYIRKDDIEALIYTNKAIIKSGATIKTE